MLTTAGAAESTNPAISFGKAAAAFKLNDNPAMIKIDRLNCLKIIFFPFFN